jgi:hypothetical protein
MSEPKSYADFEGMLRGVVRVPDPSAAFVQGLRGQIEAAALAHPPAVTHRRMKPAWVVMALLVLAIAASVAFVGPARAFEAVKRLFGFVPGIGFVEEQATLRVLEAPVTQTRDGVTLTVTDAIADPSQTVVVFQVDGLSIDAANVNGEAPANLGSHELLRLPDGTEMPFVTANGPGWGSGYRKRLGFEALPPGVDQATLEIDILMDMPPGAAPENWSLPLRFVPAPPSFTVAPVLELDRTPVPTDAGGPPTSESEPEALYGISLHLDRVVELDDGYLLVGSVHWDTTDLLGYGVTPAFTIELTDGAGNLVPMQRAGPEVLPTEQAPGRSDWAFKLPGKRQVGPMTLTLEEVEAQQAADVSFTFDAGPQPQLGQRWTVDQPIQVGGHVVTLTEVELSMFHGNPGYRFTFTSDLDVSGIALEDAAHEVAGGFGGGAPGAFSGGVVYQADPPSGVLEMKITGISVLLHGPWQTIWEPPEASDAPTATPVPQICLTEDVWRDLIARSDGAMPADLGGRLLLYDTTAPQGGPNLVLTDLNGEDQERLAWGVWPSISPDGRSAAFAGRDGLYAVDLESLRVWRIPGTNENDYNPQWSNYGRWIAFVRGAGAFDIFVAQPDGAGLQRVTNTPAYEELGGWVGGSILYASPDAEGLHVRIVDPQDGSITDLFTLDQTKFLGPSVSADGSRLSYRGQALGGNPGIYVSGIDGSSRKLVVDPGSLAVGKAVWSPDGRWLATSINDPSRSGPTPVLIQPDTCQVVPLTNLTGDVGGWGP